MVNTFYKNSSIYFAAPSIQRTELPPAGWFYIRSAVSALIVKIRRLQGV
ncbi:hypothetical protein [Candidatus Kuenenia sp.]